MSKFNKKEILITICFIISILCMVLVYFYDENYPYLSFSLLFSSIANLIINGSIHKETGNRLGLTLTWGFAIILNIYFLIF